MLQTALSQKPDDPLTLARLGQAFAIEGRMGESLVCLEHALARDPGDFETLTTLAAVDRASGADQPRHPLPATGPILLAQEEDWDDDDVDNEDDDDVDNEDDEDDWDDEEDEDELDDLDDDPEEDWDDEEGEDWDDDEEDDLDEDGIDIY